MCDYYGSSTASGHLGEKLGQTGLDGLRVSGYAKLRGTQKCICIAYGSCEKDVNHTNRLPFMGPD